MLIGITAPLTRATQLISTVMCEQLNLQHINMRQPVTNALASLLEIDSQTLLHDMDINKILPGWGKSIYTLDKELCTVARSGNAFCFLEYAGQQLEIIKAQRQKTAVQRRDDYRHRHRARGRSTAPKRLHAGAPV